MPTCLQTRGAAQTCGVARAAETLGWPGKGEGGGGWRRCAAEIDSSTSSQGAREQKGASERGGGGGDDRARGGGGVRGWEREGVHQSDGGGSSRWNPGRRTDKCEARDWSQCRLQVESSPTPLDTTLLLRTVLQQITLTV